MQTSESLAKLLPALIAAQKEFQPALKTAENPHFKSRYCDLAGCWDACRDALFNHGLTVVSATIIEPRLALVTNLYHETGEFLRFEYPLNPVKNDPQGLGAAITYARRFSLMAVLGIAPEDDDGNTASGHGNGHTQNQRPNGNGRERHNANRDSKPEPTQARQPQGQPKRDTDSFGKLLDDALDHWHNFDPSDDAKVQTQRQHRVVNALVQYAIDDGHIQAASVHVTNAKGETVKDRAKTWNAARGLLIDNPAYVNETVGFYLSEKQAEAQGTPRDAAEAMAHANN